MRSDPVLSSVCVALAGRSLLAFGISPMKVDDDGVSLLFHGIAAQLLALRPATRSEHLSPHKEW